MSIGVIGAYFDERAVTWDEVAEPSGTKHLMVAQLAGVHEGSRVLDVGCGTGIMERAYLQLGAAYVHAIDVSEAMVERAREKYADVSPERLCFECADIIGHGGESSFDVVVMYNCYPHILDKGALVDATARLLKDGGRFLVAHGMGREALNAHHHDVPASVTSDLPAARDAACIWEDCFEVDMVADAPHLYFFGGVKR